VVVRIEGVSPAIRSPNEPTTFLESLSGIVVDLAQRLERSIPERRLVALVRRDVIAHLGRSDPSILQAHATERLPL
jgi:hypothetical protein